LGKLVPHFQALEGRTPLHPENPRSGQNQGCEKEQRGGGKSDFLGWLGKEKSSVGQQMALIDLVAERKEKSSRGKRKNFKGGLPGTEIYLGKRRVARQRGANCLKKKKNGGTCHCSAMDRTR